MTTLDSSSAAESSMDESSNLQQPPSATNNRRGDGGGVSDEEQNSKESEVVWSNFTDSFREVQSVLDRNRALIHQVNENHRSKIHENMVTNVALIQEINNNVSKIVSLYSDLSTNFSSVFHQRTSETDAVNDS
ncbi:hypothetical protein L2E82_06974 [Cichorium intybus]|uniref:Uncharacterized protein n=1 Tax=Cichorium intybus TaxID=13427 RepID=A0ACB9G4Q2_CICIN|nr:hypothetical protein L1887_16643 [Cichorium endivia]KAI3778016.1 hypothetical protein L2E82_06974 [Cichorium intybus]